MDYTQENIGSILESIDNNNTFSQEQRNHIHETINKMVAVLKSKNTDAFEIAKRVKKYLNQMNLNILRDNVTRAVDKVISDPMHAIGDETHTNNLYSQETRTCLINRVVEILQFLKTDDMNEYEKLNAINEYIKENVSIRAQYFLAFDEVIPEFDKNELHYRTAYSALLEGQAMCAGYAETCRILCEASGFDTHTLLSRLPGKNKHLIHFVTLVSTSDGQDIILDPEREASCQRKGYSFIDYQNSMAYFTPPLFYYNDKASNKGVGPDVDVFLNQYLVNPNPNNARLFLIDEKYDLYLITAEKQERIDNLGSLLQNPEFIEYVKLQKASFITKGTQNIDGLQKIMSITEQAKTQKTEQNSEFSELGEE